MSVYRAPFPTPQSRRPTWRFPNELPIAGEPAGVYSTIEKAHRALAQSSYPKLLFAGNPGALISPAFAESFAKELKNCRVVQLSSGIHYLQEDHPDVIGANVKEWLIELGVVDGHRLYKANQTEHLFEPPKMAGRRTATGQYFSVGLGDRAVQTTSPMQPPNSMRNTVKLTFFFAVASVQLTSALKISALQVRPTSKVVTMRLASVHQLQVGMKSGVTFEISKIQPAEGALGNVQVIPSQQKPMIDGSPSLTVAGLQFVPNFQSAPVWLTPSQERPATVLVTVPFQVTTMEFSASFEIASVVLNSTSKEVIVQLPGAASTAGEGTPMFEIANLQLSEGGDIALMQLNLLGQGSKQT